MRLFNNRSQMTSKCGKNTFLFLPHFDVICDLLLNRRTATWNLIGEEVYSGRSNFRPPINNHCRMTRIVDVLFIFRVLPLHITNLGGNGCLSTPYERDSINVFIQQAIFHFTGVLTANRLRLNTNKLHQRHKPKS